MNTAKHTPGPWYPHCAEADHCLSSSVWGAEPGNQVAVIGGKKLDEMNANAHLIAAAPAMYTLIKDMREAFYVKGTRKALLAAMERSHEIMAQAEGK